MKKSIIKIMSGLALALTLPVLMTACSEVYEVYTDCPPPPEPIVTVCPADPESQITVGDEEIGNGVDPSVAGEIVSDINQRLEEYDPDVLTQGYLDYSMELFARSAEEGGNSMISPISVMMAMDMAASGAGGTTQSQITDVFCEGVTQAQIENYCMELMERLEQSENVKLHIANSIWINDLIASAVKDDFLVRADHIFRAAAEVLPFDGAAVARINNWCDENTYGMIPQVIDNIDPVTRLLLVNAIALDALWADPYKDNQVRDGEFTNADGETEEVSMMYGTENSYFETGDAVGFMKYYEGFDYAFLAILPDEGITVDEYVAGLTGDKYREFWESRTREYDVHTAMPEFTYEYDITMNGILRDMGITEAFDENAADFTGIAEIAGENLYISRVFHKTFIEVTQGGTRAAAVTVVTMDTNGMAMIEPEFKEVYLDRPFVYAIVEVETGMPLFIGTMQSVNG